MAFHSKFFIFLTLICSYSQAALLVEPMYHAYTGRFQVGIERGDLSGKALVLNIGYLGDSFMAGVTLEKGEFRYDSNMTEAQYEQFDGGGVGTFLGFHFFDHFKLWTSYLNSTLEPIKNKDTRYFGQYVSFGVGYRLIDGLMLNFQTFKNQFTQIEDDTTGKTSGLESSIKTQGQSLSLSYILVF